MVRRGQGAFEYVLLIAAVMGFVILSVLVLRSTILGPANLQIASSTNVISSLVNACQALSVFVIDPSGINASLSLCRPLDPSSTIVRIYLQGSPANAIVFNSSTDVPVNMTYLSDPSQIFLYILAKNGTALNASLTYCVDVTEAGVGVLTSLCGQYGNPLSPPVPNPPPNVTLVSPANAFSGPAGAFTFNYVPTDDLGFGSATLYGNFTGAFSANISNAAPLVNGTTNSLSTSLPAGYYVWNVRVCDNQGACSFAPSNFSLTVLSTFVISATNQSFSTKGYYYLSGNLTGPGNGVNFTSAANGSTLDCQGQSLTSSTYGSGYGVYLNTVNNFTVFNCTITQYFDALNANYSHYLQALNNVLYNNTDAGVSFVYSNQSTLRYNVMSLGSYGVSGLNSYYSNIDSNQILRPYYGLSLAGSYYPSVSNNSLDLSTIGVYLNGVNNGYLSGNNITNVTNYGVLAASNNFVISNNRIYNQTCAGGVCSGIYVSGSQNQVSNNTITRTYQGVYGWLSASGNRYSGNDFRTFTNAGIWLGGNNETVSGGSIIGSGTYGVVVTGANPVVAGVNMSGMGYAVYTSSNNATLSNNSISSVVWDGVYIVGGSGSSFVDNVIAYGAIGIEYGATSHNNTILRNRIENMTYGVYGGWANNTVVKDNVIQNLSGYGIYFSGSNVTVQNNTVRNVTGGFTVRLNYASNNRYVYNDLWNQNSAGMVLYVSDAGYSNNTVAYNNFTGGQYAAIIQQHSNDTIANNTINAGTGATTYGVYLGSMDNASVYGNSITGRTNGVYLFSTTNTSVASNGIYNGYNGVVLTGNVGVPNDTLSNNYIYNATFGITSGTSYSMARANTVNRTIYGITANGAVGFSIVNNTVVNGVADGGSTGYGIGLGYGLSANSTAANNTIMNMPDIGLSQYSGTGNMAYGNTIVNASNYGINICGGAFKCGFLPVINFVAYNNTIVNNSPGGARYWADNVTFDNNTFYNNSAYGIAQDGTSAGNINIRDNLIDSHTSYGMNVGYYSALFNVSGNRVTRTGTGIAFSGRVYAANNVVTNNTVKGITQNLGGASCEYCVVLNNTVYNSSIGIFIGYTYNATFANNRLYYNQQSGLNLVGTNVTLYNNSAWNNTQAGYVLGVSNSNVTTNTAENNTQHGFDLTFSTWNNMTNNLARYNGWNGTYIEGGSHNNTLTFNNFSYNGRAGLSFSLSNDTVVSNNAFCQNGAAYYDLFTTTMQNATSTSNQCGLNRCYQSGVFNLCIPNSAGAGNCTSVC